MQSAARFGFARVLARYALVANSIPAADQAIRVAPSDAHAHRARAAVLNRLRRPAEARKSLETATSLRYRDDYLWLELGNTLEELGDSSAALAAFDQAVRWAPHYAHTHWQRGNLRLRMGQYDVAFAELREAAASNRRFLPSLMDLAWGLSGGDAKTAVQLLQLNNDHDRVAFARRLLAAKAYRPAFEIWHGAERRTGGVVNGDFEEPLAFDNVGFGWIVSSAQGDVRAAIDPFEKSAGAKSLQIVFGGNWNRDGRLLSQIVIVEPERRYRISFAVKTKDLVTGGPPIVAVNDAQTNRMLAQSQPFESSTNGWQTVNIDFSTPPTSEAIILQLQRTECGSSPCPIFGVVWLDEFSIEEIKRDDVRPRDSQR
jgi:tetratricopeptide (TPR) repeat protein